VRFTNVPRLGSPPDWFAVQPHGMIQPAVSPETIRATGKRDERSRGAGSPAGDGFEAGGAHALRPQMAALSKPHPAIARPVLRFA
jgi:hypothetical protein